MHKKCYTRLRKELKIIDKKMGDIESLTKLLVWVDKEKQKEKLKNAKMEAKKVRACGRVLKAILKWEKAQEAKT